MQMIEKSIQINMIKTSITNYDVFFNISKICGQFEHI